PSLLSRFSLIHRPPPSSTLFPYTTLFRSRRFQPCHDAGFLELLDHALVEIASVIKFTLEDGVLNRPLIHLEGFLFLLLQFGAQDILGANGSLILALHLRACFGYFRLERSINLGQLGLDLYHAGKGIAVARTELCVLVLQIGLLDPESLQSTSRHHTGEQFRILGHGDTVASLTNDALRFRL